MQFFHLICEITPHHKKPYLEHVVISEEPLEFLKRNLEGYRHLVHYGDHFQVNHVRAIDKKTYKKHKKLINPRYTRNAIMALYLLQADWSRVFTDRFGM
jgi:hypothetical protein